MESLLLVAVVVLGLGVGTVWYSTQMKKNYLHELEKELELQKFVMTGSMGKAHVEAVWRGIRIWIDALPTGPSLPSAINYRMEQRSSFTAEIRPGQGLVEEVAAKAKPVKQEEETIRPWRVKLTDEEQAVIDQRRGDPTVTTTTPSGPKERFRITSPKPDEVSRYLAQGKRSEEIARMFEEGISLITVGFTDVMVTKSPYGAVDMSPKNVEKRLRELKALRIE